jgi:hypothetical protein
MDETAWNPAMAAYVRLMVERAPRRPVLQFNRIDFRLPWFRRTFPAATIVHLFRHPRDQWCSSLGDSASCSTSCTIADFRSRDGFYLLSWAADLKYRFPFLDVSDGDHPYRLFYFIWKLSYLFGIAYADYSISFESLVTNPETESKRLFTSADLDCADLDRIARLVEPTPNRWRQYGSDAWFRGHEELCEQVLHDVCGASELREGPPIPHTAVRGAGVEELVGR